MTSGLQSRNGIWYARTQINGRDYRFSLKTRSEPEARRRLDAAIGQAADHAGRVAKVAAYPAPLTVNAKGNIGLLKIAADLAGHGFDVYLPISGASPVDLIVADARQRLRRLQAKYRSADKARRLAVSLASVVNGKKVPCDLSLIDGWAIYCPDNDGVYYLPKPALRERETTKFVFSLKKEDGVRFAPDYSNPVRLWQ